MLFGHLFFCIDFNSIQPYAMHYVIVWRWLSFRNSTDEMERMDCHSAVHLRSSHPNENQIRWTVLRPAYYCLAIGKYISTCRTEQRLKLPNKSVKIVRIIMSGQKIEKNHRILANYFGNFVFRRRRRRRQRQRQRNRRKRGYDDNNNYLCMLHCLFDFSHRSSFDAMQFVFCLLAIFHFHIILMCHASVIDLQEHKQVNGSVMQCYF